MNKKRILKDLYGFIFTILLLCLLNVPVAAATPQIIKMSNNVTYKTYDLDGDNKKDSIKLKTINDRYGIIASFYINGRKLYTLPKTDCMYAGYYIITLKNGKNFIYAHTEGPNSGISQEMILQYKNKKMINVVNFTSLLKKYQGASYISWYPSNGISVANNTINVTFTSMSWTLGGREFIFKYTYKDGTLKRTSYGGTIKTETYTTPYVVAKRFPVYTKAGGTTRAFTVSVGQKVTVPKYYLKNGKLWLQIKNSSGRTGWIKALEYSQRGYSRSPLFSNAYYSN